jgi:hypothetical protein
MCGCSRSKAPFRGGAFDEAVSAGYISFMSAVPFAATLALLALSARAHFTSDSVVGIKSAFRSISDGQAQADVTA